MPTARMSLHELKVLLDDVPDTLEIVLRGPRHESRSLDAEAWRDAHEEAQRAWGAWRAAPGDPRAYAVYRAAQDREDAAQDALAHTHTSRSSVS
jgi:hypothetical protein